MQIPKQTTTEPIAVEGFIPIGVLLAFSIWAHYSSFGVITQTALFAVSLAFIWFFRNPERICVDDSLFCVLAPTDGVVESIDILGEYIAITIHTKLTDTHIIRAPVRAQLISTLVRHGAFLPVDSDKASLLNESYVTTWKSDIGYEFEISFTLGSSPAKIALYPQVKKTVRACERIAFVRSEIKTVLKIPKETKISVTPGVKILAGESALGYVNMQVLADIKEIQ